MYSRISIAPHLVHTYDLGLYAIEAAAWFVMMEIDPEATTVTVVAPLPVVTLPDRPKAEAQPLRDEYYLKISGRVDPVNSDSYREFEYGVGNYPITMGRAVKRLENPPYHLNLDPDDTLLSREHLKIDWNPALKCFEIECLSKNGIIVNKKRLNKSEKTELNHVSAIRAGTAKFYVNYPLPELDKKASLAAAPKKRKLESVSEAKKSTKALGAVDSASKKSGGKGEGGGGSGGSGPHKIRYQKMLNAAFESNEIPLVSGGALQKDLVEWIMRNFAEDTAPIRIDSLKKGVYGILNRYFERVTYIDPKSKSTNPPLRWTMKIPAII